MKTELEFLQELLDHANDIFSTQSSLRKLIEDRICEITSDEEG